MNVWANFVELRNKLILKYISSVLFFENTYLNKSFIDFEYIISYTKKYFQTKFCWERELLFIFILKVFKLMELQPSTKKVFVSFQNFQPMQKIHQKFLLYQVIFLPPLSRYRKVTLIIEHKNHDIVSFRSISSEAAQVSQCMCM